MDAPQMGGNSGRAVIATWFLQDTAAEASWYPQVGANSSSPTFQLPYWRCVSAFFVSCARFAPDAEYHFFTNADLPTVDGVEISDLLGRLGVVVHNVLNSHVAPAGYYNQWRNQFYVLDILEYYANGPKMAQDNSTVLILDSDCIIASPLDKLFDEVAREGIASYVVEEIAAKPEWSSNGLNGHQLTALGKELSGRSIHVPYCGGEIIALSLTSVPDVARKAQEVWMECLERNERGLPKFNEEAQLLSYVYADLGLKAGGANGHIRRIWTQRYNNSQETDLEIAIWHLPAEKKYGFRDLMARIGERTSWVWSASDDDFRARVAVNMGLPRSNTRKLVRDRSRWVGEKLHDVVTRGH